METIANFLNEIRTPDKDEGFKQEIIHTSLIFILGVSES